MKQISPTPGHTMNKLSPSFSLVVVVVVVKILTKILQGVCNTFCSLSNESYELNFYLRLILGPIPLNQVMELDPVNPIHGTQMDQLISIM